MLAASTSAVPAATKVRSRREAPPGLELSSAVSMCRSGKIPGLGREDLRCQRAWRNATLRQQEPYRLRETMSVQAQRTERALACFIVGCIASIGLSAGAAEAPGVATQLPAVEVVGTTPLPSTGLERDQVPAPVQSATDADIRRSQAL